MTFRVGQKVVCVDVSGLSRAPWNTLKLDAVYTIAKIGHVPPSKRLYVDLAEGPASPNEWPAFFASRFRPVVSRKTDISIFTEMLKPNDASIRSKEFCRE